MCTTVGACLHPQQVEKYLKGLSQLVIFKKKKKERSGRSQEKSNCVATVYIM